MKCEYCDKELNIKERAVFINCPFCNEALFITKEGKAVSDLDAADNAACPECGTPITDSLNRLKGMDIPMDMRIRCCDCGYILTYSGEGIICATPTKAIEEAMENERVQLLMESIAAAHDHGVY